MNTAFFDRLRAHPRDLMVKALGPVLSKRRPGRVVLLHHHRCGSTVVGKMLAAHPKVSWCFEVLTHNMLAWEREHGSRDGWDCDIEALLQAKMQRRPMGWFGCEITTHNTAKLGISMDETIQLLLDLGFSKFIVLERRNHLRRYISSRLAAANSNWHIGSRNERKLTRIHIDPETAGMDDESGPLLTRLRSDTADVQELWRAVEPLGGLHLVYEDHIEDDPTIAFKMICEYIGVPPSGAAPSLVRKNPYPVEAMLENYDEIAATLRGSEFEWMLTV